MAFAQTHFRSASLTFAYKTGNIFIGALLWSSISNPVSPAALLPPIPTDPLRSPPVALTTSVSNVPQIAVQISERPLLSVAVRDPQSVSFEAAATFATCTIMPAAQLHPASVSSVTSETSNSKQPPLTRSLTGLVQR